jgi:hypothetical protein
MNVNELQMHMEDISLKLQKQRPEILKPMTKYATIRSNYQECQSRRF